MKIKIDRLQYFFLIPNLLFGKAIGITSGIFARRIGSDTWTSMLLGFIIGCIIVLLMIYLCSKFPKKTIIQFSQDMLGKIPAKCIGILLAIFFGIAFMISANVITLHLSEYFLPETPFIILCIVYILLCTYGVMLGLEVVIRFSFFGFIMINLINLTMTLGIIRDFNVVNLRPLFDRGLLQNIYCSFYLFSDLAMVILSLGIIYPMLNKKDKIVSISFISMLVSTFLIIIWPISETGVMGADVMKQFVIVCMQQVRSAQLSIYFPRYELIMVIFFVWGVYVQSTVMFYCFLYSIKQVTNIKKPWKIMLPTVIIFIAGTNYMGHDHNNYIHFIAYPWSQICTALSIGIPVLLLVFGGIGKKFKKSNEGLNV